VHPDGVAVHEQAQQQRGVVRIAAASRVRPNPPAQVQLANFQQQRHSDHHAHPSRRYQCLRHFPDLPQSPSGYFGMFPLAYVPPLWFRMLDPRLLALPQVQGDLARVNVDPVCRSALEAR
jgi:hypothetical protein